MTRPTLAVDDTLIDRLRGILESGMITNGSQVAAFEAEVAAYLGVAHVIAVNSCTAGLMLVLRCLGGRGPVVLPSFTFMATGHAVMWNGQRPIFADCDPDTFTLDPGSVRAALTDECSALLGVHVFGSPCAADELEKAADAAGVPLIIDAAHAFGGRYPDGRKVGGKGVAEVFSLSPTKPLSTGEGGLIATGDTGLARALRSARDYGNPGDYDSRLVGLNGRMNELAAAIGRHSLPQLDGWLAQRGRLADRYRRNLQDLPGIDFQRVLDGSHSVFKDFTITVAADQFGLHRDQLALVLAAENINTRKYFSPPVHQQTAYRDLPPGPVGLFNTTALARRCLSLPLYSHMDAAHVDAVSEAIHTAWQHRGEIVKRLGIRSIA